MHFARAPRTHSFVVSDGMDANFKNNNMSESNGTDGSISIVQRSSQKRGVVRSPGNLVQIEGSLVSMAIWREVKKTW